MATIVADKLPKFLVMKSVLFSGYTRYMNETPVRGYVLCQEESVFSQFAKIEVEHAKINKKYVHLRFSHTNKYWARSGPGRQIVARSDQPEEDKSKSSCTMFEPKFGNDGLLYLTHVQSGRRLRTDDGSSGEMTTSVCVDDEDDVRGHPGRAHAFRYVDWDTLVKVPKNVAFKGDNGKYLQLSWDGNLANLQFSGSDKNAVDVAHEVHLLPDGHIRIKSKSLGLFWRRKSDDWINSNSNDGGDLDTLFWPVKVDTGIIALRSAGNNQFCGRNTNDYLVASHSTIMKEARFKVEERVLQRSIYDVIYRMDDARVYDEELFVAGIATARNESDTESSLTVTVAREVTDTYVFTNSFSVELGVETTIKVGIPLVEEGKFKVSAETTSELVWTKAIKEVVKPAGSYTVKVPARRQVTVSYVGTHGKSSIPFSYTQRDKSSTDGQLSDPTQHIDGIFERVGYYSFDFKVLGFETL